MMTDYGRVALLLAAAQSLCPGASFFGVYDRWNPMKVKHRTRRTFKANRRRQKRRAR